MSVETHLRWFAEAVAEQSPSPPDLTPMKRSRPVRPLSLVIAGFVVTAVLAGLVAFASLLLATSDDPPAATTLPPDVPVATTVFTPDTSEAVTVESEPTPSEAFDSFVADWSTQNDDVGISAAVMSPDGELWLGASGLTNRETSVEVLTSELFPVASVTKTFMAVLALSLAEEGVIDLDEPISAQLPDFPAADVITVRQLLGHRAGVYDPSVDLVNEMSGPPSPSMIFTEEEVIAATAAGTPVFPPGSMHSYSNGNYILLGAVLEQATGSRIASLLETYIASPLQLNDTVFYDSSIPDVEIASAYTDLDLDGTPDRTGTTPMPGFITPAWTAGAVISTPADLVVFLDAVFAGEIVGLASIDALTDTSPGSSYGLGIYRSAGLWGHDGGIKGYLSAVFHDPDTGLTVAVSTNYFGPDAPQADAAARRLASLAQSVLGTNG